MKKTILVALLVLISLMAYTSAIDNEHQVGMSPVTCTQDKSVDIYSVINLGGFGSTCLDDVILMFPYCEYGEMYMETTNCREGCSAGKCNLNTGGGQVSVSSIFISIDTSSYEFSELTSRGASGTFLEYARPEITSIVKHWIG